MGADVREFRTDGQLFLKVTGLPWDAGWLGQSAGTFQPLPQACTTPALPYH
jgi:hypothetical protein